MCLTNLQDIEMKEIAEKGEKHRINSRLSFRILKNRIINTRVSKMKWDEKHFQWCQVLKSPSGGRLSSPAPSKTPLETTYIKIIVSDCC